MPSPTSNLRNAFRRPHSSGPALLALLALAWGPAAEPESESRPATTDAKSLVIALDGVRPDALAHASTPRLDGLIDGTWQPGYQGAYSPVAQNLGDAVTLSGPNHAAILTGANATQHGVSGNKDVAAGDFVRYPHYLTLIEAADPSRGTAYLFTWKPDGKIASRADYVKGSNDARNTARAAAILAGTHEDARGDGGTAWSTADDVDALFLFLDDADHAGHVHGYGPGVAKYIAELEELDGQVGTLLDAIAGRASFAAESWQIVITSDHGGYHRHHKGSTAPERTIPFLVAGRDVAQGRLPEITRNVDVVPTVLTHLGVPIPGVLTGVPRGAVAVPDPPPSLGDGLVGYYRFEGDLLDTSDAGNDGTIGSGSGTDPKVVAAGGAFGGFLSISAPSGGGGSYVTLGKPADFDFGDDGAFTVTLWYRSHGTLDGDPVIIGNQDRTSGGSGWLILANAGKDRFFRSRSFGTRYASAGERLDLENIDYAGTDWWFLAAVLRPDGLAVTYAGDSAGALCWMALDATSVGPLSSGLPINIGQDGTGTYGFNLTGDVDDLAIWRRALTATEINRLYGGGKGPELGSPPARLRRR